MSYMGSICPQSNADCTSSPQAGPQDYAIKTDAPTILDEAKAAVYGPRQASYGHPRDNFGATAALWNAYLFEGARSGPITAEDVALMMTLVKVARLENGYHHDSVIDIAGYAATYQRLQDVETTPAFVLHTPDESDLEGYTHIGYTEHDEPPTMTPPPRVWDQITQVNREAPEVTKLTDADGFIWEKRGRRWGWWTHPNHGSEVVPIWHHTEYSDLRHRSDGPFTEVVE